MRKITAAMFYVFMTTSMVSQTIKATTEDGKKVLLNADSTWTYQNSQPIDSSKFDCALYVTDHFDKLSGTNSIHCDSIFSFSSDGKNGFLIQILRSNKGGAILYISAFGAGDCIEQYATCQVLFTDGTRMSFTNDNEFNCKNTFLTFFGGGAGRKKDFDMLCDKTIEMMRIKTKDGTVTETFNPKDAELLRMVLDCYSFD